MSLTKFYPAWDMYGELLEAALAQLDDSQLAFQAAPEQWSVGMIASHVVAARAWWFNSWMGEGGEDLARLVDYDEGEESKTRGVAEIIGELRRSRAALMACLEKWTEDDVSDEFQRPAPNAERGRPWRNRGWIIWHVAEHDVHHGGEISLMLGMLGLTGLDP